jgi:hypothetical protein
MKARPFWASEDYDLPAELNRGSLMDRTVRMFGRCVYAVDFKLCAARVGDVMKHTDTA